MKKYFVFTSIILFSIHCLAQNNVGIGTSTPNISAALDISSSTKGLLIPRLTTAQRSAINSPAKGLLVFDTDNNNFWYYNGNAWTMIGGAGGSLSLPYAANVNLNTVSFKIENSGAGDVLSLGSSGAGAAINAYSSSGNTINANAYSGFGVYSTSWTSSPIFALANNLANTAAAIRADNTGGGVAIHATASNESAITCITTAVGSSAISAEATNDNSFGVYGASDPATGTGVYGHSTNGKGVVGNSSFNYGVMGKTFNNSGFAGVYGVNYGTSGAGVQGLSNSASASGVYGSSLSGKGVNGYSENGTGLYGSSATGYALQTTGKIKISGGNTNPAAGAVLTSDAAGNAIWKGRSVAFKASGIIAGNPELPYNQYTKVQFKNQEYDLSGSFISIAENGNLTQANVFYPPVNGIYHFDISVGFGQKIVSSDVLEYNFIVMQLHAIINGADVVIAEYDLHNGENVPILHGSSDAVLHQGDQVYIAARQLTSTTFTNWNMPLNDDATKTYFSGHLVKEL